MALVDFLLTTWLRFGRCPWSRLRRWFERRYLKCALPRASSLDEVESLLGQVTWTMDGLLHLYDSISYPQTVWATKKDDCDGFAVLAAELLRDVDPTSSPVLLTAIVRPASKSHTVCAFRDQGALRYSDNDRIDPGTYSDYAEIASDVARRGTGLVCWDIVDPRSLRQLEFHRSR